MVHRLENRSHLTRCSLTRRINARVPYKTATWATIAAKGAATFWMGKGQGPRDSKALRMHPTLKPEEYAKQKEETRRTTYRMGCYFVIILGLYMVIWGWGLYSTEECGPTFLPMIGLLGMTAFTGGILFIVVVILYSLMRGEPEQVGVTSAMVRTRLLRFYNHGPTLFILALIVIAVNFYTVRFRYRDFSREGGYYVYDRWMHQGVYVPNVDCHYDPHDQGP